MPKSGSFTLVLTVICLSVLMSLEADAQSTTDETNSCSSSSLEEVVNLVKIIALNQQQNAKDIKELLAGNSSMLKEVANVVKRIASNQANVSKSCELEPSKQALVSALVGKFDFHIFSTRQLSNINAIFFNGDYASAFTHKCKVRFCYGSSVRLSICLSHTLCENG